MVDLVTLQYGAAGLILVVTLLGNFAPLVITAHKWTERLESLAGGVFMGAALGHLLDDALIANQEYTRMHASGYPLPAAVCFATFVLLTFVELFSHSEHDIDDDRRTESGELQEGLANADEMQEELTGGDENEVTEGDKEGKLPGKVAKKTVEMTASTVSMYVIMLAHSAIEGLAFGVSMTMSSIIAVFCAIVGHKPVEAFAVSVIILKCNISRCMFVAMVLFYSLFTPLGIVIGISIGKMKSSLALVVIDAFSAGTFLFVGCHEWAIMFRGRSRDPWSDKIWRYGAFFIGAVWMLLICLVDMNAV